MDEALRVIGEHGYTLLFAWVWIEQFGLPVPGEPMLVAAGALVGAGQLRFAVALGVATAASLLADLAWYAIGRRWGSSVVRLLCWASREPESCGRGARDLLGRFGGLGLVIAKFVPGLNTLAQPVAGALAMPLGRFVVFDVIGAVLWLGTFLGIGAAFSEELTRGLTYARGLGVGLLVTVAAGLAAYSAARIVGTRRPTPGVLSAHSTRPQTDGLARESVLDPLASLTVSLWCRVCITAPEPARRGS